MKRAIIGAVLLAILAAPAYAADRKKDEDNPMAVIEANKRRENAEIEKQYKRTLQATDAKATPAVNDPWANMRGTDTSKPKR